MRFESYLKDAPASVAAHIRHTGRAMSRASCGEDCRHGPLISSVRHRNSGSAITVTRTQSRKRLDNSDV
jgi:hypothetical protein